MHFSRRGDMQLSGLALHLIVIQVYSGRNRAILTFIQVNIVPIHILPMKQGRGDFTRCPNSRGEDCNITWRAPESSVQNPFQLNMSWKS